jgi:3-oxocholest-4-en-26-oate---CoA ligase
MGDRLTYNLADLWEAVSDRVPEREAVVCGDRRLTYAQLEERANRLANHLSGNGVGPGDLVGCYLTNGTEYLETLLACFKIRAVPVNINYRYVTDELRYLLDDSGAGVLVCNEQFVPRVAEVAPMLPALRHTLVVAGTQGDTADVADTGVPDPVDYESALAAADARRPEVAGRGDDDLYILYTGGTTGMPKGVLWRQGDIFPAAMGGRDLATGSEWSDFDAILDNARNGGVRLMPAPPFMHGAAHWMAFTAFNWGNTLVLPRQTRTLDTADIWATVQQEGVNIVLIVGDAFGRPLLDELERGDYDTSSMLMLVSGGAALSAPVKQRFLEVCPTWAILDGLGSSETGQQASQVSAAGTDASTGTFTPGTGMCIVSEDLSRLIDPSSDEMGWLAQRGRVPLGYLGDRDKTQRTFPVIAEERYSVPGDRANFTPEGLLQLHGRDSVTINSGGEKIFAEEVEQALTQHPSVYDVVVAARPSTRWGNEVVAIVQLVDGHEADVASLLAECEKHIARYKLPKDFVFVDRVVRSPAGKADYRWARDQATATS